MATDSSSSIPPPADIPCNYLGSTGLKVSNICLGTMTFGQGEGMRGGQSDEALSHKILDRYAELKGNFIDTADAYPFPVTGLSETILGDWLAKRGNRDEYLIATKLFAPMNKYDPNSMGLSRKHIISAVEASLKRLQTDYIDLYQTHAFDYGTPINETYRTLDDLVRCGKVRYIGLSNVLGWQFQKIVDTCKHMGLNPIASLQAQYSLMCRHTEWELMDVCKHEGIGLLPWSPLKGGWLTGKFTRDSAPAESSRIGQVEAKTLPATQASPSYSQYANNERVWALLDEMKVIANSHTQSVSRVALRWLLQKKCVDSVVIGARTLEHLEDNAGAGGGWQLTEDEMNKLDTLSAIEDVPYPYDMVWRMQKMRERK